MTYFVFNFENSKIKFFFFARNFKMIFAWKMFGFTFGMLNG